MSRTRLIIKRGFAVMLSLVLLIGAAACGNSSGQSETVRDTIEQVEDNSEEKSSADLVSEPVTEEPVSGTEVEVSENTTDGAWASNILIAYFSRVGNMDFDEDIDAVTSASVNMDGSDVSGNAQLLAEMAQEVTGGDLFFIETVEKYPAEYRGTTDRAKTEQNDDARPELLSHVGNMNAYNTVILIYPNWLAYHNLIQCTQA